MATFNAYCLNVQRDPETGCAYDCGDRHDYQSCRQSYYLKKQTDITTTIQKENKIVVSSSELEKENASLKSQLATQIDTNNQIKTEYSNYYHLTGFTITLIILLAVTAGYLINFFTRKA